MSDQAERKGYGAPQPSGLRRALFIALSLALIVPGMVAGSLLIYLNLQRTLDSYAHARAEKFADILQAGLVLPLWEMAPESGVPLLDAVASDPSIRAIRVDDTDGGSVLESVYNADSDSGHTTVTQKPHADRQAAPLPATAPPDLHNTLNITRTIERAGETLGHVTLVYGTTQAREEAGHASQLLLAVVAAQLLVSFALLGTWLTRRVLRPLSVLRASAEVIAGGDLQSPVPHLRADEFGLLAKRLDSMRDSLDQSVTRLEERVALRTHELTEVNQRLQGTLADLRRMQNQLVQSEKLAALGALVAGLAHELNTPIGTGVTVVSTIAERCIDLQRQVQTGIRRSQLESFINDVEKGSRLAQSSLERAAQLIQDFKQVAVDQTSSRRRQFLLADLIREMMVTLRILHKHSRTQIEVRIPKPIAMDSYPGALEQIISNLVENAIAHAFDETTPDPRIVIEASIADPSERVTLCVRDNGHGIPAANLDRIFDPFFTTRLGSGGSGLGLSIAYNLVGGMLGGEISVASQPGAGACFTLELPLTAPEPRGAGG